jgi:hypothetical protein
MSKFQEQYPHWRFLYNFFPSYHGDGICDGLAAIGKRALKRWEKDQGVVLSASQLVTILQGVEGFQVTGVSLPVFPGGQRPVITTIDGCCKWYYKYTFPSAKQICAFEASTDLEPKKVVTKENEIYSFLWD